MEAKRLGCYEVTLNVWAGNTSAEKFYEKGIESKRETDGIYLVRRWDYEHQYDYFNRERGHHGTRGDGFWMGKI